MVNRQDSHIKYENIAGALLFCAGVLAFLGIITAETLYPGYSTSQNMISDLGATEPPNSIIIQPSSSIFSASMAVCGLLVTIASYFLHRAFSRKAITFPLGLFGVGVLGVGIFNGSYGAIHGIFALLTFIMEFSCNCKLQSRKSAVKLFFSCSGRNSSTELDSLLYPGELKPFYSFWNRRAGEMDCISDPALGYRLWRVSDGAFAGINIILGLTIN